MATTQRFQPREMARARALLGAAALAVVLALVAVLVVGGLFAAAAVLLAVGILMPAVMFFDRAGIVFEVRARSIYRSVCKARSLAAKTTSGTYVYAPVGKFTGSTEAFTFVVRPLAGQSLADWEKVTDAFALAYGVTSARVTHGDAGRLVISVGYAKMPVHEFVASSPVAAAVSWREQLGHVQVGRGQDGSPFLLPVIDSHILIAGTTGAGKGSVVWSALLGLLPAYDAGVVRFWGLDPKRMEIAMGRSVFGDTYAADSDTMIELLQRAVAEMYARADQLAGRVRKFEPSIETPLNVIVVDELGVLASMLPDRKQKTAFDNALNTLLALGRAVGFVVIGAVQDPRKETLDARDLFPVRVAMRLPKPMVDLVLGTGMYAAGAQCDLIPFGVEGAGVAFVVDESSTQPRCVRMSWCSDELIAAQTSQRSLGSGNQRLNTAAI